MCFDDIYGFVFKRVEDEDGATGRMNMSATWWGVRGWSKGRGGGFLRQRVCQVAAVGGRREGADGLQMSISYRLYNAGLQERTMWIWRCLNRVEELHVADIVDVDLVL